MEQPRLEAIKHCADVMRTIHDLSTTSGNLHLTVDDSNLEDEFIVSARAELTRIASGDVRQHDHSEPPELLAAEWVCLEALEKLSELERRVAFLLADTYPKPEDAAVPALVVNYLTQAVRETLDEGFAEVENPANGEMTKRHVVAALCRTLQHGVDNPEQHVTVTVEPDGTGMLLCSLTPKTALGQWMVETMKANVEADHE